MDSHAKPEAKPDPTSARAKLLAMEEELNESFLERGEEVRGLICGLIARENVLLLGPPGTAKSALAEALCARLETASGEEGGSFYTLLSRTATPEQLFGPVSIRALENDSYARKTAGYLPEASVAFIDEIFKGNSAILNGMLSILNERVFVNDGRRQPVPLKLCIGASNELPADREELDALWDRFVLRFQTSYLSDASFEAMLHAASRASNPQNAPTSLSTGELEAACAAASEVKTSHLVGFLGGIRRSLKEGSITASDRRYARGLSLVRAHAFLEGRTESAEEDLAILQHALWPEPSARHEVRSKVMEVAAPQLGDAQDYLDQAREIHQNALSAPDGEKKSEAGFEANGKLKHIHNKLCALAEGTASSGGARTTVQKRIEAIASEVARMNEEVLEKCLGMST
jgi:MoxR-like ATPase